MKEKLFKKGITRRLFSVALALAMVVSLLSVAEIKVYALAPLPTQLGDYQVVWNTTEEQNWFYDDQWDMIYCGFSNTVIDLVEESIEWGDSTDYPTSISELTVGTYNCPCGYCGCSFTLSVVGGSGPDTSEWPTDIHTEGCYNSDAPMHFYATGNTYEMNSYTLVEGRLFVTQNTYDYYYGSPDAADAYPTNKFLNGTCSEGWYWYDATSYCFKPCVDPTSGSGATWKTYEGNGKKIWYLDDAEVYFAEHPTNGSVDISCYISESAGNPEGIFHYENGTWSHTKTCDHIRITDPNGSATHTHGAWDYTVENTSTLKATCGNEGCDDPSYSVSLTLSASSANYSGITGLSDFNTATGRTGEDAISESDVKLYTVATEGATTDGTVYTGAIYSGRPAEKGNYYASLTVGDATAVKAFKTTNKVWTAADGATVDYTRLNVGDIVSRATASTGTNYYKITSESAFFMFYIYNSAGGSVCFFSSDGADAEGFTKFSCTAEGTTMGADYTVVADPRHSHDWQYFATGNKLEATCTCNSETAGYNLCTYKDKTGNDRKVSLTLTANDANYSGSAATINIGSESERTAWTSAGLTVPSTISYEKKDGTNLGTTAPTTVGDYVEKVTVEGATAQVSFTIEQNHGEDTSKYAYDDTNHWRPCLRSDCTETTHHYNSAGHSYDSGTHKCVCGKTDPQYHQHSYESAWSYDDTNHWHACTGTEHTEACLNDRGAAKSAHGSSSYNK